MNNERDFSVPLLIILVGNKKCNFFVFVSVIIHDVESTCFVFEPSLIDDDDDDVENVSSWIRR